MPEPLAASVPRTFRLIAVASVFLRLGCTAFGGPIAHVGYLREALVTRRKWLDDERFGDLLALCQFLPGPASSQLVFAIGQHRAGIPGAIVASACFTLPSALIMLGAAYGFARLPAASEPGWLHGLHLSAVAVVAQAVWQMGQRLWTDRLQVALGLATAAAVLALPGPVTPLVALAVGGGVGAWFYRQRVPVRAKTPPETGNPPHRGAVAALAAFVALLAGLPVLAGATGGRALAAFDSFYRAGALVFGGGHVVLPLLRAEIVPRGWISDDAFLAGYAVAQALPGPLFACAAYLGATLAPDAPSWPYGLWCTAALFLPGGLLIGGALPFWQRLRAQPAAQAALAGSNAAVVGVLLAALGDPVLPEGVRDGADLAVALLSFIALERWKVPPWTLVLLCAASGQWWLG